MSSLLKAFGTDKSKEKDGVWVNVLTNDDETLCRFKIARMGSSNKELVRRQTLMAKKYRTNRGAPSEAQVDEMRQIFVDTVLLDWDNVEEFRKDELDKLPTSEDGKTHKMPFNRPNAIALLKMLPDLFDLLVTEATSLENFNSMENEEIAKN